MNDKEIEQKIEEIFQKYVDGQDFSDPYAAMKEAYSLGQSHMRVTVSTLVKQYLKEIDESENLNDIEKGLIRWGIENIEIRLSEINEL